MPAADIDFLPLGVLPSFKRSICDSFGPGLTLYSKPPFE
jgi:hypothetical protein